MNHLQLFGNSKTIAYKKLQGNRGSLVFFCGFASNMNGNKATYLYKFCQRNDLSLILFDYLGHGDSTGKFLDYTISDWCENCLTVINELTDGKQIIIGSSMGAWLMLLVALQLPEKVASLIGVSSAPDFTENLIFNHLSNKQKNKLDNEGIINFSSQYDQNCTYQITKSLIEDGRKNLLLNKDTINILCPVRLLHGINDKSVPYHTSLDLAEKIKSPDIQVYLIKSAEHNMSDGYSMRVLFNTIKELL